MERRGVKRGRGTKGGCGEERGEVKGCEGGMRRRRQITTAAFLSPRIFSGTDGET